MSYDTIYCIEYSYLVLDTIYFTRSKFCPSEAGDESDKWEAKVENIEGIIAVVNENE